MKKVREGVKRIREGLGQILWECGEAMIVFADMVKFYNAVNLEIEKDTYLQAKMTEREAAMKATLVQIGEHETKLQQLSMKDYPENFHFKDDLKRLADLVNERLKK